MDPESILIFLLLFLLSGFFSGSETALMSLPRHKVDIFLQKKRRGAKALALIKQKNERLLIALLIGNNLVNVMTASYATILSTSFAISMGRDQNIVLGVSTGLVTFLLLLFGEIIPKTFATRYGDTISLRTAKFYQILLVVLRPIVFIIEKIVKILQKKPIKYHVTQDDVLAFLSQSYDAGAFDDKQHDTLRKIIYYYDITAEEIMTPRTKIEGLQDDETLHDAITKSLGYSHSRLPVYKDSIDQIHRVVSLRDLLAFTQEYDPKTTLLSDLPLPKVTKIPLTQPIHKLLEGLQKTRSQLAVVVDEYGGVAGLVTVEDIIEEVFGEIRDETDKEKEPIKHKSSTSILVQAEVRREEVVDALELDKYDILIPEIQDEIDSYDGETMSYMITSIFHRFPRIGEKVVLSVHNDSEKIGDLILEVIQCDDTTIYEIFCELKVLGNSTKDPT